MSYQKLVRDRIPDKIRRSGQEPIIKILDDTDFERELYRKLDQEEWVEFEEAVGTEAKLMELGDVLEVVETMKEPFLLLQTVGLVNAHAEELGSDLAWVQTLQRVKALELGGFSLRIYLEGVEAH